MLRVMAQDKLRWFLIDRKSIYPVVMRNSNGFWQKCADRALRNARAVKLPGPLV